ncbi:putative PEP-CTERM/exosortase system-associated acyltransferase [Thioalkalivibrio nitratireducens DSM 14787]|uniref:PEP-CTERM/exosortase system-associated acyltransferase n=1 Tax=Thioalkalivibrio nitratireducens (strain DSM 14787 / UNIQEM 213 / ALEN2) TaxID=1255043 RepID=L0E3H6_THIND|nr:PEP-CTERM/exosortase system-associated acyltransferase [Thioalkalivibrio nitratireducens]AGA35201.1 putative PEP-CTERM/exosortase system-associated acyltransferase [Thioalkalivibrio nitratireducens DSM 14787]
MNDVSLVQTFGKYFDLVVPAEGSEEMNEIFRIRYEVYCREFHFEREEDCPGGMETDEYDARSWHCMIRHRPTEHAAGCVRLIGCDPGEPSSRLPLESKFGDSLFHSELRPDLMDRGTICEISRLAVHSTFRRRVGELSTPLGNLASFSFAPDQTRTFPLVTICLFMAVLIVGGAQGKEHGFAMMEPRLARLLKLSGFRFTRIGETVDYRGTRAAYYMDLARALRVVRASRVLGKLYTAAQRRLEGATGWRQTA